MAGVATDNWQYSYARLTAIFVSRGKRVKNQSSQVISNPSYMVLLITLWSQQNNFMDTSNSLDSSVIFTNKPILLFMFLRWTIKKKKAT